MCIKLREKFPILGIGSCSLNREKKPWVTEALPGVGVQGEKSIHLRVTEEQRAQLILRGRGTLGNRENMGNKGTGTIFPPWEGLISSL